MLGFETDPLINLNNKLDNDINNLSIYIWRMNTKEFEKTSKNLKQRWEQEKEALLLQNERNNFQSRQLRIEKKIRDSIDMYSVHQRETLANMPIFALDFLSPYSKSCNIDLMKLSKSTSKLDIKKSQPLKTKNINIDTKI